MRSQQLIRQWKIIALLSTSARASYRQAAEALQPDDGVSLRTLQRDLQALEMAGFALQTELVGREVFWSLRLKHGLPFPIELPELIALQAATLSAQAQGLPESVRLDALWRKLVAQLPSKTRSFLESVRQALAVFGPARLADDGAAGRLAQWAAESKSADVLYDSLHSGRCVWRRIDPYAIITAPSGTYLWGYCHLSRQFRVFQLARIRELRDAGILFRRIDLSPRQAFENSFEIWQGDPEPVCIRFTGAAAVLAAERRWHRSQVVRKVPHGVELRLQVHPGKDLERWILGFGAGAEVLAPASLRQRIVAEARTALMHYAGGAAVEKRPVAEAPGRRRLSPRAGAAKKSF